MTTTNAPFRYDVVGSFLRPQALKDARQQFADGQISAEELRAVEDKEIIDLIKKQEAAGLKSVTDGEFRRRYWHTDFFWGLNGVERKSDVAGYEFEGITTPGDTARIVGRLSGENHPFVEDFKFVRDNASDGIVVRQTIPAPAQFFNEIFVFHTDKNLPAALEVYPEREELLDDLVKAYKTVIQDLYDAGLRNLQLDDCSWDVVFTHDESQFSDEERAERDQLKDDLVTINNRVIDGLPEDLVVTTHVCRGNFASYHFATGGYASVSDHLFARENADAFYLEYDTDRSGGFEPLADLPKGSKVVLGLITSKTGELEDKEAVKARIQEASQYIPLEDLYLSPQCGFSSTEEGNALTEDAQWAKVALVKEIAEEVWEDA